MTDTTGGRGMVPRALLALAAAGAMLATAVPAYADSHPAGRVAPKGDPGVDATPSSVTFLYAGGAQTPAGGAAGASIRLSQEQPVVAPSDYHSLAELAVESADGRQVAEVGWTVDPSQFGDGLPHLFVFHWVDGTPTCYDGCGFVQVSPTVQAGQPLTPGAKATFGLRHRNARWWATYNGEKVGYFPDAAWSGGFTRTSLIQVFGEVAAGSVAPCTDMGNGVFGHLAGSAVMTRFRLQGTSVAPALTTWSSGGLYDVGASTPTGFRYGGPGAC
jgi:hypothetical protein